jgi:hypothetical protein
MGTWRTWKKILLFYAQPPATTFLLGETLTIINWKRRGYVRRRGANSARIAERKFSYKTFFSGPIV